MRLQAAADASKGPQVTQQQVSSDALALQQEAEALRTQVKAADKRVAAAAAVQVTQQLSLSHFLMSSSVILNISV